MNHQKSEAFFSFRGIRGAFQQMFTFVIGISCGNTPFVQKHESTTHVNGFVFDSIFSVGKYFVRTFHVLTVFYAWYLTDVKYFVRLLCKLTVSASQNQF